MKKETLFHYVNVYMHKASGVLMLTSSSLDKKDLTRNIC